MAGSLISDGLKGFTESLKILDTTLDLATLIYCVKLLLIKVHTLLVRHSPPYNLMNSWYYLTC